MSLLCWNIGYGGLGKNEDFFMDGGKLSKPQDRNVALTYLDGIRGTIAEQAPDLVILQEVDSDSSRTYGLDERSYLDQGMSSECYALNYSCPFVPVPWPPSRLMKPTASPSPAPSPGRCASRISSAVFS